MKIRVLGCSGSIAEGSRTTSFLVDRDILLDAGTGVGDLPLDELAAIDHICISHSHLDHVLSIGLLADSVLRLRTAASRPPIIVHALPQTIAALREHIFNGVIWPDFTRLPNAEHPTLAFEPFEVGDVLDLAGRRIEVLSAVHTVPAVGFAVLHPNGAWVFTGDTGPNPKLWERLRGMKLRHLVIETAFSNDESTVAKISGHLCPATLGPELAQLEGPVDVAITHIKPGEVEAVMAEIGGLRGTRKVHALATGDVVDLAAL